MTNIFDVLQDNDEDDDKNEDPVENDLEENDEDNATNHGTNTNMDMTQMLYSLTEESVGNLEPGVIRHLEGILMANKAQASGALRPPSPATTDQGQQADQAYDARSLSDVDSNANGVTPRDDDEIENLVQQQIHDAKKKVRLYTGSKGLPFLRKLNFDVLDNILTSKDFKSELVKYSRSNKRFGLIKALQLHVILSSRPDVSSSFLRSYDDDPVSAMDSFKKDLPFAAKSMHLRQDGRNMNTVLRNAIAFSDDGFAGVTGFLDKSPLVPVAWLLKIAVYHCTNIPQVSALMDVLVAVQNNIDHGEDSLENIEQSALHHAAQIIREVHQAQVALRLYNQVDSVFHRSWKRTMLEYEWYDQIGSVEAPDNLTTLTSVFGISRKTYMTAYSLLMTEMKGRTKITEALDSLGNPRDVPVAKFKSYSQLYQVVVKKADLLKTMCKVLGGFTNSGNVDARVTAHLLKALARAKVGSDHPLNAKDARVAIILAPLYEMMASRSVENSDLKSVKSAFEKCDAIVRSSVQTRAADHFGANLLDDEKDFFGGNSGADTRASDTDQSAATPSGGATSGTGFPTPATTNTQDVATHQSGGFCLKCRRKDGAQGGCNGQCDPNHEIPPLAGKDGDIDEDKSCNLCYRVGHDFRNCGLTDAQQFDMRNGHKGWRRSLSRYTPVSGNGSKSRRNRSGRVQNDSMPTQFRNAPPRGNPQPAAPSAAAAALNEQALIDRIITAIAAKTAPDSAAPVNAAVQSAEVEFNGVVYVPKV